MNIHRYLLFLLIFCACEKQESSPYSDLQRKAFEVFTGTFADVEYSNLGTGPLSYLMPDPDLIIFEKHYSAPKSFYTDDYMQGKTLLFSTQGECTYWSNIIGSEPQKHECYYYVSPDADFLSLYYRAGDMGRYFMRYMQIKSKTEFHLWAGTSMNPYRFLSH